MADDRAQFPTAIFTGRFASSELDEATGLAAFKMESEPFQGDPPYAPDFHNAIGRMVIMWGRFLHHLEISARHLVALATTYGIQGTASPQFSQNAKTLPRLYRECPGLTEAANDAEALMRDAEAVSIQRNIIIHSNINGWGDVDPPYIKLRKYEYEKKRWSGLDVEMTLADLNKVGDDADSLNLRLLVLSQILQRLPPGPGKKA